MKLYELLETAKKTGDMIVRKKDNISMRYNVTTKSFVFCDRTTGEFYIYGYDETGYNQVILSDKLFTDDWYLEPIHKTKPIDINGTKFTNYDDAIEYLNKLKSMENDIELLKKVYRETGKKPLILADEETIEFIYRELDK